MIGPLRQAARSFAATRLKRDAIHAMVFKTSRQDRGMTHDEQAALHARLDAVVDKLDQNHRYDQERRKEINDKIDTLRSEVRDGFAQHGDRIHQLETTMTRRKGWTEAIGWVLSIVLLLAGAVGAFITWGI